MLNLFPIFSTLVGDELFGTFAMFIFEEATEG